MNRHLSKLAIIFAALIMVFAFAACGTTDDGSGDQGSQDSGYYEDQNTTPSEYDEEYDDPGYEDLSGNHYYFRNQSLLNNHYDKHGREMGFASAAEYEEAACQVINNPDALSKVEAEDGDTCFYVEATNEFVVLSTDGYIRTYFKPDAGKKYYDKQ